MGARMTVDSSVSVHAPRSDTVSLADGGDAPFTPLDVPRDGCRPRRHRAKKSVGLGAFDLLRGNELEESVAEMHTHGTDVFAHVGSITTPRLPPVAVMLKSEIIVVGGEQGVHHHFGNSAPPPASRCTPDNR